MRKETKNCFLLSRSDRQELQSLLAKLNGLQGDHSVLLK